MSNLEFKSTHVVNNPMITVMTVEEAYSHGFMTPEDADDDVRAVFIAGTFAPIFLNKEEVDAAFTVAGKGSEYDAPSKEFSDDLSSAIVESLSVFLKATLNEMVEDGDSQEEVDNNILGAGSYVAYHVLYFMWVMLTGVKRELGEEPEPAKFFQVAAHVLNRVEKDLAEKSD